MDEITTLAELSEDEAETAYAAATAIFWETAQQSDFADRAERDDYIYRYFGYYRDAAPELFFVARETDAAGPPTDAAGPPAEAEAEGPPADVAGPPTVLGYVCAVADTRAHPELYRVAAHVPVFDDLYDRYPAHLHINLAARSRGRGLGGALIAALERRLIATGCPGVHLVTNPGARNVSFYQKNGFIDRYRRTLHDETGAAELLFLGKRFV